MRWARPAGRRASEGPLAGEIRGTEARGTEARTGSPRLGRLASLPLEAFKAAAPDLLRVSLAPAQPGQRRAAIASEAVPDRRAAIASEAGPDTRREVRGAEVDQGDRHHHQVEDVPVARDEGPARGGAQGAEVTAANDGAEHAGAAGRALCTGIALYLGPPPKHGRGG